MKVKIKPMSVNQAWQGRRYKTPEYKAFRERLQWMLKDYVIPDGSLKLTIEFGVSNMAFDVDNGLKPFIDALQDRYDFNDNRITELIARKHKTTKGHEYINWSLQGDY